MSTSRITLSFFLLIQPRSSRVLCQTGVVRARKRTQRRVAREGDKSLDGAIRSHTGDGQAADDHEQVPQEQEPERRGRTRDASRGLVRVAPVVVQPHEARYDDRHDGAEQCTDERDQSVKYWDGLGDDERERCREQDRPEPDEPVRWRVGREVLAATEDAHEDVLGRQVGVCEDSTVSAVESEVPHATASR